MDTLLKKLWNALRKAPKVRDRRRIALRQALQCDALEGRQLLSGYGGMMTQHAAVVRHPAGHAMVRGHARLRNAGPVSPVQNGAAGTLTMAMPTPTSTPTPVSTPTMPTTQSMTTTTVPSQSQPTTMPQNTWFSQGQTWNAPTTTGQPGTPPPDLQATTGSQGNVTTTATATTPPAPPSNPALTSALDTLQTDIHAIMAKSQVTVAQTVALHDDLQAIGKASTSAPSQDTLQAFQKDLAATQGALPTAAQKTQLEADYTALVKSQGVTDQSLIDKAIGDAEAIITSSGVTSDDLAKIAADQKAIQTALGTSASSDPTAVKFGGPGMGFGFDLLMGAGGFDAWQIGMPNRGPMGNQGFAVNGSAPGTTTGSTFTVSQAPVTGAPTNMMMPFQGGPTGQTTMWTASGGGGSMPGTSVTTTSQGPGMGMPMSYAMPGMGMGMGMPMGRMMSMGGPMGGPMIATTAPATGTPGSGGSSSSGSSSQGA